VGARGAVVIIGAIHRAIAQRQVGQTTRVAPALAVHSAPSADGAGGREVRPHSVLRQTHVLAPNFDAGEPGEGALQPRGARLQADQKISNIVAFALCIARHLVTLRHCAIWIGEPLLRTQTQLVGAAVTLPLGHARVVKTDLAADKTLFTVVVYETALLDVARLSTATTVTTVTTSAGTPDQEHKQDERQ
jgi:hypothetical protein